MRTLEAEANGKTCHKTLALYGDGPGCAQCIGSVCMAWRWSRAKETKSFLEAVRAHMAEHKIDFSKAAQKVFETDGAKFEQVEGYCGLAGKPE